MILPAKKKLRALKDNNSTAPQTSGQVRFTSSGNLEHNGMRIQETNNRGE